MKGKPPNKPVPAKRRTPRLPSKSDEVLCDICHGDKSTAVKSCLVCQKSYCEIHLTPHLKDPVMTKHRLTDPGTFATSHLCRNHKKLLDMFCKRDQAPVCIECTERDHKHHDIVPIERMGTKKIKVRRRGVFNLLLSSTLSHNNA